MKAVVCEAYGPPESVVVKELPSPEAGAGAVSYTHLTLPTI